MSFSQKINLSENQKTDSLENTRLISSNIEPKLFEPNEEIINVWNRKLKVEKPKNQTIEFIKSKWFELLGLLIVILVFFIPVYKYLSQKREEQKDKRFETYHKLVANLVNAPGGMFDRQIATVFEFRNFPDYFELSGRILTDL